MTTPTQDLGDLTEFNRQRGELVGRIETWRTERDDLAARHYAGGSGLPFVWVNATLLPDPNYPTVAAVLNRLNWLQEQIDRTEQEMRALELQLVVGATVGIAPSGKPSNAILQYFTYEPLPAHLQRASEACAVLANMIDSLVPESAEKTAGLRKLLEAKDCFVRALLVPGDVGLNEMVLPK